MATQSTNNHEETTTTTTIQSMSSSNSENTSKSFSNPIFATVSYLLEVISSEDKKIDKDTEILVVGVIKEVMDYGSCSRYVISDQHNNVNKELIVHFYRSVTISHHPNLFFDVGTQVFAVGKLISLTENEGITARHMNKASNEEYEEIFRSRARKATIDCTENEAVNNDVDRSQEVQYIPVPSDFWTVSDLIDKLNSDENYGKEEIALIQVIGIVEEVEYEPYETIFAFSDVEDSTKRLNYSINGSICHEMYHDFQRLKDERILDKGRRVRVYGSLFDYQYHNKFVGLLVEVSPDEDYEKFKIRANLEKPTPLDTELIAQQKSTKEKLQNVQK